MALGFSSCCSGKGRECKLVSLLPSHQRLQVPTRFSKGNSETIFFFLSLLVPW